MKNVESMMEDGIERNGQYIVKIVVAITLVYLAAYMWILLNTSMTILAIPVIVLISGILALLAGYYKISIQFHIDTNNMNLDTSQDSTAEDDKKYNFIPVKPQGPNPYKVNPSIVNVLEPLEPVTPPLALNPPHED
jgi:hypothetical protein